MNSRPYWIVQRCALWLAFITCGGVVSSCGGSSDGVSTSLLAPRVTILWPATTRAINAPEQANHATIRIALPGTNHQGQQNAVLWEVDRPAGTAEVSATYAGPLLTGPTPGQLEVRFFYDETPSTYHLSPLATAASDVYVSASGDMLNTNGTPLGPINASSNVAAIEIGLIRANPLVDEVVTLYASGRDGSGNVCAIPTKYVDFSVVSGSEYGRISGNQFTGLAVGKSTIQLSYQGLSTTFPIEVGPKLVKPTLLPVVAGQVQWDPTRGVFWGAFGGSDTLPDSLAQIDPITGALSHHVSGLVQPTVLSLSNDGHFAFLGVDGSHSMVTVNLDTLTPSSSLSFGQNTVTSIAVNPTDSSEQFVCSSTSSPYAGPTAPVLVRSGVVVGTHNYAAATAQYVNGTTVCSGNQSSVFSYDVGPAGLTLLATDGLSRRFASPFIAMNGNIISSEGDIWDGTTLKTVNKIARSGVVCGDPAKHIVWILNMPAGYPQRFTLYAYNTDTTGLISSATLDPGAGSTESVSVYNMMRYGTSGIALNTSKGLYVLPNAPGIN